MALTALADRTAQWSPYIGTNGGWVYSDGSTAIFSPYIGTAGGYYFSNGGTVPWEDFNPKGGPHWEDPYIYHHPGWRFLFEDGN